MAELLAQLSTEGVGKKKSGSSLGTRPEVTEGSHRATLKVDPFKGAGKIRIDSISGDMSGRFLIRLGRNSHKFHVSITGDLDLLNMPGLKIDRKIGRGITTMRLSADTSAINVHPTTIVTAKPAHADPTPLRTPIACPFRCSNDWVKLGRITEIYGTRFIGSPIDLHLPGITLMVPGNIGKMKNRRSTQKNAHRSGDTIHRTIKGGIRMIKGRIKPLIIELDR